MRTITVERTKRFVGSLAKFTVYAEDHEQFDNTIGDVPCRTVGLLKNGGSVSFQIGDEETRVFVTPVAGNGVEMMRIPEGQSDLTLTGQVSMIGSGMGFWFDGNDSEEAQATRKAVAKNGKKTMILSIILTSVLVIAAIVGRSAVKNCNTRSSNKEFNVLEMTIKLNNSFTKKADVNYAAVFLSSDVNIAVYRELKDDYTEYYGITLDDYARAVMDNNEVDDMGALLHEDGIPYVEYTNKDENSGQTIKGYVAFYESKQAFWFVQFYSLEKDYKKLRPSFVTWAKSVTFND